MEPPFLLTHTHVCMYVERVNKIYGTETKWKYSISIQTGYGGLRQLVQLIGYNKVWPVLATYMHMSKDCTG